MAMRSLKFPLEAEAKAARQAAYQIGQNVPVHVRRKDDILIPRVFDKLISHVVNLQVVKLQLGYSAATS
jgi:hypothetical protein